MLAPTRRALLMSALMCSAAAGAYALRPGGRRDASETAPAIDLELLVPKAFGAWRQEAQQVAQVVNPQTQQILDKLYNQVLTRTYVSDAGERIMLSLAYGGDQRGSLEAHKPEVCYPAQGFKLLAQSDGAIDTAYGNIPVRRLNTSLGRRIEPLTYWFTVGESTVLNRWEKRLVEIRLTLTGQIPDGLLFRVSSIDADTAHAWKVQEQFVNALMSSVQAKDRARLAGLSEA
jgi:EpsI family protein